MFRYALLEARIPHDHPLRATREMANRALARLDREFRELYSKTGRPSISPEQVLRALLSQVLYLVRSERTLTDHLQRPCPRHRSMRGMRLRSGQVPVSVSGIETATELDCLENLQLAATQRAALGTAKAPVLWRVDDRFLGQSRTNAQGIAAAPLIL